MKVTNTKKKSETVKRPTWKQQGYASARHFVAIMTFLGITFLYMLRLNINLTIIAMVKHSNHSVSETSVVTSCEFHEQQEKEQEEFIGDFMWDEFTQSLILGSFAWGYLWLQIPGGRLSEFIGPRRVIGYSILVSAILTLFIPLASHTSPIAVMVVRFLMGLAEGPCCPSTHALLAIWAPSQELSLLSTIIYAGRQAGTIIAFPMSALIINFFGWEWVFYIQAIITVVWAIGWFLLVTDRPNEFRWISDVEKEYLEKTTNTHAKNEKPAPFPWKSVLTSTPFLSIVVAGIGNNWGFFTLVTDLPLYMKHMMHFNISHNALLSGLPYLGMWIFSLLFSYASDYLIRKNKISKTWGRKIATFIAHGGPGICLVCLSLVECERTPTIYFLFVAVILQGAIYSGWIINSIDIAPNFAGTLYGITNALASIPSWVAPIFVGTLTNNNQTFTAWRTIFFIAGGIFIFDSIFFMIFGTAKVQEWNYYKRSEKKEAKGSEVQKDDDKQKSNECNLSRSSSTLTIVEIV